MSALFSMPSDARIDAAYISYASNLDGSMNLDDLNCAVRSLTGERLPLAMRDKTDDMIEEKGGITRADFRKIIHGIVETQETRPTLEELWEELTGDQNACIRQNILIDWISSSIKNPAQAVKLSNLIWDQLEGSESGFAGLKEVRKLLNIAEQN